MKSFKTFSEDGMGGGSVVGGIAGTGGKAGEPGVTTTTQKKIQNQGQSSLGSRASKVKSVNNTSSLRRITQTKVGFPLAKPSSYSEETKKNQKIITKENGKTKSGVKKTALDIIGFSDFMKSLKHG